MKVEVTLQLTKVLKAKDEEAYQTKLEKLVESFENKGYEVVVDEEDYLDDVLAMMNPDTEASDDN